MCILSPRKFTSFLKVPDRIGEEQEQEEEMDFCTALPTRKNNYSKYSQKQTKWHVKLSTFHFREMSTVAELMNNSANGLL